MENPEVRRALQVSAPTYEDGTCVISIVGELDAATAPLLQEALAPVLAAPELTRLILDLAAITFVDSSGWRVLIHARRVLMARGGELVFAACSPYMAKELEQTRMNLLFNRIP